MHGSDPASGHRLLLGVVLACLLAARGSVASISPSASQPASATLAAIPPRSACAPTGSELLARLAPLTAAERGRALVEELLQGNVPSFLRTLRPIEMAVPGAPSGLDRAVVWVMPDYLAVGSDTDYLRVPLGLDQALEVARRFGCTLPTRKMVDTIHRQAERRLEPRPMPAGPAMTSLAYVAAHNRTIEEQLGDLARGVLVAGDKKDLVLSRRLAERPGRVAIYGWHRADGRPIQPLSTVHEADYADYSHGIRLVSSTVLLAGQSRSLFDLLEDPALVGLVSDEGVDRSARRVLTAH